MSIKDYSKDKICYNCKYGTCAGGNYSFCNYLEITGHMRGCDADYYHCEKFERGEHIVVRKDIYIKPSPSFKQPRWFMQS